LRFLSFATAAGQRIGIRRGAGIVDLTGQLPKDLASLAAIAASGKMGLAAAKAVADRLTTVLPLDQIEWRPPLSPDSKVIGIGLNYRDHAVETGLAIPTEPVVFLRVSQSLTAHQSPIQSSRMSGQLDFEGELAVVIGKRARHVERSRALEHVFGYTAANDGSVRDFQLRTPQWTLGKNFDLSGAIGPEVVTADELPLGATGLAIRTRLNGQTVQSSNTRELIFDVSDLIARLSAVMTLNPGDVILTGTPGGVGGLRTPPLWMKPGDVCEVEIEKIGVLKNTVELEPEHRV
jgi:acylpyruvate hydrolase